MTVAPSSTARALTGVYADASEPDRDQEVVDAKRLLLEHAEIRCFHSCGHYNSADSRALVEESDRAPLKGQQHAKLCGADKADRLSRQLASFSAVYSTSPLSGIEFTMSLFASAKLHTIYVGLAW